MIRVLVLFCCLLLITACGSGGANNRNTASKSTQTGSGGQIRTLTKKEADSRAEEHIKQAVAALPVEPNLALQYADSAECLDPIDNGPRGRYQVGRTYWLDELPSERNADFVDTFYSYWIENGYRVLTDKRSSNDMFVSVENEKDAFRMSVKQSVEGNLSLGASSPCVWPDGVPPSSGGK